MAAYFDGPSGPSTNYAEFETRWMPLEYRAGIGMAQLYFGLDIYMIEGLVGRYKRGPRKGQLRGGISWTRCVHGGWVTGRGLSRKGVTEVELRVPDGWDPRHQVVIEKTLVRYNRLNGIEYY